MKCFVAGGAGFIGSNLVLRLLKQGWGVTVYDNLSGGWKEFLAPFSGHKGFKFVKADLLNRGLLDRHIKGHDAVFHFAASSDISLGIKKTGLDLKNSFLTTFNILDSMKRNKIGKLVFASSGSVYGEYAGVPFKENSGPILPVSLYAASKAASEAYISAFCSVYGIQAWVFRLANIVGPNATHGVVFDFIKKLKYNPKKLRILGDGNQKKPYLYVGECIDGILYAFTHAKEKLNYFNLSPNDVTDVKNIAKIVINEMGFNRVRLAFTNSGGGWPGDQKRIWLNPSKINRLGWKAKLKSAQAVRLAVLKLLNKEGL